MFRHFRIRYSRTYCVDSDRVSLPQNLTSTTKRAVDGMLPCLVDIKPWTFSESIYAGENKKALVLPLLAAFSQEHCSDAREVQSPDDLSKSLALCNKAG